MDKLKQCYKQKNKFHITSPNHNLAIDYIDSSKETHISLRQFKDESNMWKIAKKYYAKYLAVYGLLIKIGIRSQIHDCTIELTKHFSELFPHKTYETLNQDKKLRIDNQYYLKNTSVNINCDEILEFILEIEDKINTLTETEILSIRKQLQKETY